MKTSKRPRGRPPIPGPQRYACSARDLATFLDEPLETIRYWKTLPGNPGTTGSGRYPIQAWRDWATNYHIQAFARWTELHADEIEEQYQKRQRRPKAIEPDPQP